MHACKKCQCRHVCIGPRLMFKCARVACSVLVHSASQLDRDVLDVVHTTHSSTKHFIPCHPSPCCRPLSPSHLLCRTMHSAVCILSRLMTTPTEQHSSAPHKPISPASCPVRTHGVAPPSPRAAPEALLGQHLYESFLIDQHKKVRRG